MGMKQYVFLIFLILFSCKPPIDDISFPMAQETAPEAVLLSSDSTKPEITIQWNADMLQGSKVVIYKSMNPLAEFTVVVEVDAQSGVYIDNNVSATSTYYYKLSAKNRRGDESDTTEVFLIDTVVANVTNLIARETSTGVILEWDSITGVDHYEVYTEVFGVNAVDILAATVYEPSYLVPDSIDTNNRFYVTGVRNEKRGPGSKRIFGRLSALETPENLVIAENSYKGVRITWDAVENAASYIVRRAEGNPYKEIGSVEVLAEGLTELEFVDTNIPLSTYSYSVQAVRENGDKGLATQFITTSFESIPAPVISVTNNLFNKITLEIQPVHDAVGYIIYNSYDNELKEDEKVAIVIGGNTTSCSILRPDSQNYLRAVSIAASGNISTVTETLSVYSPSVPEVTNLQSRIDSATGTFYLSWDAIDDPDIEYSVYYSLDKYIGKDVSNKGNEDLTSTNSFTLSGLEESDKIYASVRAVYNKRYSASVSVSDYFIPDVEIVSSSMSGTTFYIGYKYRSNAPYDLRVLVTEVNMDDPTDVTVSVKRFGYSISFTPRPLIPIRYTIQFYRGSAELDQLPAEFNSLSDSIDFTYYPAIGYPKIVYPKSINSASFQWDATDGAIAYNFYLKTIDGESVADFKNITDTSLTVNNLDFKTRYQLEAEAVFSRGVSTQQIVTYFETWGIASSSTPFVSLQTNSEVLIKYHDVSALDKYFEMRCDLNMDGDYLDAGEEAVVVADVNGDTLYTSSYPAYISMAGKSGGIYQFRVIFRKIEDGVEYFSEPSPWSSTVNYTP